MEVRGEVLTPFHGSHAGGNRLLPLRLPALALLFVTGDQAVADAQDAPRVFGHVFLMRHHDDGVALLGEFAQTTP